jgi:cadmium resistance protein CadD (predicted permease)
MSPVVQIIGVSCAAFVSTNLDTFWLLISLYASSERGSRALTVGYLAATALVGVLAWLGSSALEILSARQIDYLGLIPLGMGIYRGWALFAPQSGQVDSPPPWRPTFSSALVMTLSQSADNFAILASLFADTRASLELTAGIAIAVCAIAWSALAHWVGTHRLVAPRMRRIARFLLPVLLIAVGLHLLADTAVDEPQDAEAPSPGAPQTSGVGLQALTHLA